MSHTAFSLSSSPNPRLLEMRIMTHHANDDRFAFLRGRYKSIWLQTKEEARKSKSRPKEEKAMGALVGGYESSDEDDEDNEPEDLPPTPPPDDGFPHEPPLPDSGPSKSDEQGAETKVADDEVDEEEKKRERRRRAEEWKRKRARGKEVDDAG